ncbi:hypothetical protein N2605_23960 [Bradyrhizobium yuanmingense]|uniref:hypothetical protein n=1 Tax=Bradyrhizobium yuanmingense TaxID=108015 RepID=UPI0021A86783|nr:hypothetical protein [Bradyrhizobium sp. CB1024]UWU82648.1 hypothetical protein N2605_23960 [Bradyrhizobium sp. CB1024]
MTIKTSPGTSPSKTSRNRPGSKPRVDKECPTQQMIAEDGDVTPDDGRDLAHGEGGSIDLPTKPGDMSKDD